LTQKWIALWPLWAEMRQIFHKVVELHVFAVKASLMMSLSQFVVGAAGEGTLKIDQHSAKLSTGPYIGVYAPPCMCGQLSNYVLFISLPGF